MKSGPGVFVCGRPKGINQHLKDILHKHNNSDLNCLQYLLLYELHPCKLHPCNLKLNGEKNIQCAFVYNNQINNNRELIGNNRNSANDDLTEYLVLCSMESQCSCLRTGLLCRRFKEEFSCRVV